MAQTMSKAARLRISQAMKASHAARRAANHAGTAVNKALEHKLRIAKAVPVQDIDDVRYDWTYQIANLLGKQQKLRLIKNLLEDLTISE